MAHACTPTWTTAKDVSMTFRNGLDGLLCLGGIAYRGEQQLPGIAVGNKPG